MSNQTIKVLIVDDHMVVRKGLTHVLDAFQDITVVAEAESGEQVLYLCQQQPVDVVLMDVKMQGMGGVVATQIIRQFHPETKVIALSSYPDEDCIKQMLNAKANGYLLKNISSQELVHAIRSVQRGKTILSPEVNQVLKSEPPTSTEETAIQLSTQQQKVLNLLAQGLNNVEIANKLYISPPTARYHVSAILLKLGVSNRVEAAIFAVKAGLVKNKLLTSA